MTSELVIWQSRILLDEDEDDYPDFIVGASRFRVVWRLGKFIPQEWNNHGKEWIAFYTSDESTLTVESAINWIMLPTSGDEVLDA